MKFPPFSVRCLFLLLGCGLLAGSRALAAGDDNAYRINVRSFVDRPRTLFGKKPVQEHGKLYAIAGIKYSNELWGDGSNPITVPVYEDQVLDTLREMLTAQSFHEAQMGQFPDIVLTVFYGRGHMKNPYKDKTMEEGGSGGQVVNTSPDQLLRERGDPGYADKVRRAESEKLFIAINAWEYPGLNSQAKKKLLWRVTVSVDDPDKDLNEVAPKMLAAAAPYFDHETAKEEVTVMSDLPEGTAHIGPLIDLGAEKSGK